MTNFAKFLQLSFREQVLLFQTAFYIGMIKAALMGLPLRFIQAALKGLGRLRIATSSPATTLERSVWAVNSIAGRLPGSRNCLIRALALQTLLAHRGLESELRIGFAKTTTGTIEGHAWLEYEDRVIMGAIADLSRFAYSPSKSH